MTETDRIVELPVMEFDTEALRSKWTERLRRSDGTWTFFADQALGLEQAHRFGGGLFPVTTGGGKTLLSMALPLAMGVNPEDTVVLCPPGLETEAAREREKYVDHFDLEPTDRSVVYVPYSTLSREQGVTLLDNLAPKLIIADEAHNLKNKDAARTNRFLKYMAAHPDTMFVALSATFVTSSLEDFAHLAKLALRHYSPLPHLWPTVKSWSRCIDVFPLAPASPMDWYVLERLISTFGPKDLDGRAQARAAFRRRLETAPGVVISDGDSCDTPLIVEKVQVPVPSHLTDAVRHVRSQLELPNGSEVDSPMHAAEKSKQLSLGFYYFPDWPNGEPDREWLYKKRAYMSALHAFVNTGRKGLDTPFLVERALRDGKIKQRDLLEAWSAWQTVVARVPPPQAEAWVTTEVMESVARLAEELRAKHGPLILWVGHDAAASWFGRQGYAVSEIGKRPLGPEHGIVVNSIASHGTGYNLQEFTNNLVVMPPSNAGMWQQMLGRTHRAGQSNPVRVWVLQHTTPFRNAWSKARKQAAFIEETISLRQKLNHLQWGDVEILDNGVDEDSGVAIFD